MYEDVLPAFCAAALGVELRDDPRYEWAVRRRIPRCHTARIARVIGCRARVRRQVLLLWTVPAYVVCEIVSTWWLIRMSSRLQPPATGSGRPARAAALDLAGVCEIVYTRLVYVVFLMQIRLLSTIPLFGLEKGLTLLLSALIHAYDPRDANARPSGLPALCARACALPAPRRAGTTRSSRRG